MLTFEMTLISLYEWWPVVLLHVTADYMKIYRLFSNIIKSSKKGYLNICDLDKKSCFACKADFWNDPYFYMKAGAIF